MATEWPQDADPVFAAIEDDLAPLRETFGEGTLQLPDGLEHLADAPLSSGTTSAVPWEYVATPKAFDQVRLRGEAQQIREVTIRGVTIVDGEDSARVFRRYVDWAEVWAQLGVSSGRGELAERQFLFGPDGLGLDGEPLDLSDPLADSDLEPNDGGVGPQL